MSLWSALTGTEDQDTQDAQFAQKQAGLAAALAAHPANGDPAHDAIVVQDQALQSETLDSSGFLNSFETRNDNTEAKPGAGDLATDVLILAALLGGAWAFFAFGGFVFVRLAVARKNWTVAGIAGAGAALWAYFFYKYATKAAADAKSITAEGLSLFSFLKF